MKHSIFLNLTVLWTFFLAGCQARPAITPTAAEIVNIEITLQPSSQPTPDASPSPDLTSPVSTPDSTSQQAYPPALSYPVPGLAYPQAGSPYIPPEGVEGQALEPYIFKTSQPETATLHGWLTVIDPLVLIPAPDDAIYLVPLVGQEGAPITIPPIEKGKTIQAEVDERTGEFSFTNIQPGQYAVVVVTNGGSEITARIYETGNLAIITVEESDLDKIKELDHLVL